VTSQHDDSPSGRRQAALAVIAFAATLTLLFGLSRIVDRAMTSTASASPSATRTAASVGPSPSVEPSASAVASASSSAGVSESPSSSGSAGPAPPSPSPSGEPVLVGAGDIGDCETTDDTATAALVAGVAGTVFTTGDNAYPDGRLQDFLDCYEPTWGAFKARTRPAPGNHEWRTDDLKGYLDYFGTAAAPNGTPWYSYDLGTWHIVVLDSSCDKTGGCGPDSEQGRWLAADLAASDVRCTLAIWHAPRFSSGSEHGNEEAVAPFWEALYAADADLVLNGHDHDYERFAPQDPGGREDRERGIREFVVGTGGAKLRQFDDPEPNSELRAAVAHGVLKLVLHAESYEWSFLPTTGTFADSGSNRCH
jgi:calcineurin-like phosphoesterase family protein